jgi:cyclomaltodextrinase
MWAFDTTIYQIYPLGFCGCPHENDGVTEHRILKVNDWIQHFRKLNVGGILFNPVFESDSHGYDTRDYQKIDGRLGTNEDFRDVCGRLHDAGIRVILDGVFNHVGRGFFAFRDVCEKKQASKYAGWFNISFDGNSCYNDGFWYEGWEGHFELVKLNLKNPEVKDYLLASVGMWIDEFGIDGIRLDVAYMVDRDFLCALRDFTKQKKNDFVLIGEILGGDYNPLLQVLDSVTNYECCKGIWSSINSKNFFEISYSYNRQFGNESWCLYHGRHLLSFIDNHDVERIATVLSNQKNLGIANALMFTMPGFPCVYYGSEWGIEGRKSDGDWSLRPSPEKPEWNELTDTVAVLAKVKEESDALRNGGYRNVRVANPQMIFERKSDEECVYALFNLEDDAWNAEAGELNGSFTDLMSGEKKPLTGSTEVPGHGFLILRKDS